VLIGALMIHEVVPGPRLFEDHPEIVYGLFASLLFANLVLLLLGLFGSRLWVAVTVIPKPVLYPLILAAAVVGSFSVRNSMFDVASCLAFGCLGWILRRHNYPVVPIVLGMVLGTVLEVRFRQAVLMQGYSIFFQRRICFSILVASALSILIPVLRQSLTPRDSGALRHEALALPCSLGTTVLDGRWAPDRSDQEHRVQFSEGRLRRHRCGGD